MWISRAEQNQGWVSSVACIATAAPRCDAADSLTGDDLRDACAAEPGCAFVAARDEQCRAANPAACPTPGVCVPKAADECAGVDLSHPTPISASNCERAAGGGACTYTPPPCQYADATCGPTDGSANTTIAGSTTCIPMDAFECNCEPGWSGEICDFDEDECASDPCQNGGVCTDSIDGYMCACAEGATPGRPGWDGDNCETEVDLCALGQDPCHARATCTHAGAAEVHCQCWAGYAGDGDASADASGCSDIDEWCAPSPSRPPPRPVARLADALRCRSAAMRRTGGGTSTRPRPWRRTGIATSDRSSA